MTLACTKLTEVVFWTANHETHRTDDAFFESWEKVETMLNDVIRSSDDEAAIKSGIAFLALEAVELPDESLRSVFRDALKAAAPYEFDESQKRWMIPQGHDKTIETLDA